MKQQMEEYRSKLTERKARRLVRPAVLSLLSSGAVEALTEPEVANSLEQRGAMSLADYSRRCAIRRISLTGALGLFTWQRSLRNAHCDQRLRSYDHLIRQRTDCCADERGHDE